MPLSTYPTLLLTPGGSRTRQGSNPDPELAGGAAIAPGQYGSAWTSSASGFIFNGYDAAEALGEQGTILVRYRVDPGATAPTTILQFEASPTSSLVHTANGVRWYINATVRDHAVSGVNTFGVQAIAYDQETYRAFWNGDLLSENPTGGPVTPGLFSSGYTGEAQTRRIEAILCYDVKLTDAEIAEISAIAGPWTWEALQPLRRYVDVLPEPGTNADAPVLTLP